MCYLDHPIGPLPYPHNPRSCFVPYLMGGPPPPAKSAPTPERRRGRKKARKENYHTYYTKHLKEQRHYYSELKLVKVNAGLEVSNGALLIFYVL